ncbi:hypothetical protein SHELI_v1c04530 [Spiroplasma helicoides]|uniref:Lipoprotein n=2 Tax=Spiroplasma TaxID=2132 RepID=A0A1B3SKD7_9MOLU|nr:MULTISPECIES: hypothetical protein [Spiroplasma]AOG60404.1 hypothetical protein SHELI_v1c04530 [Spiroplasma helicoides]ASP28395.1 hypothetical protein SCORR_v1c06230 [Spiroplasma corruscae]
MKKILGLLGAISIGSVSASSVISCGDGTSSKEVGEIDKDITSLDGISKDITLKKSEIQEDKTSEAIISKIIKQYSKPSENKDEPVDDVISGKYYYYLGFNYEYVATIAQNYIKENKTEGFEGYDFNFKTIQQVYAFANLFFNKVDAKTFISKLFKIDEVSEDKIEPFVNSIFKHLFLVEEKTIDNVVQYVLYSGSYNYGKADKSLSYNGGMILNVTTQE